MHLNFKYLRYVRRTAYDVTMRHAHWNAVVTGRAVRSLPPQPRQVGLVVYLTQNLSLRGRSPPIIFARVVRPINALQLCR